MLVHCIKRGCATHQALELAVGAEGTSVEVDFFLAGTWFEPFGLQRFALQNPQMLRVALGDDVLAIKGAMVAYQTVIGGPASKELTVGRVLVNHRGDQQISMQPYNGKWSGVRLIHVPLFQTTEGYVETSISENLVNSYKIRTCSVIDCIGLPPRMPS